MAAVKEAESGIRQLAQVSRAHAAKSGSSKCGGRLAPPSRDGKVFRGAPNENSWSAAAQEQPVFRGSLGLQLIRVGRIDGEPIIVRAPSLGHRERHDPLAKSNGRRSENES